MALWINIILKNLNIQVAAYCHTIPNEIHITCPFFTICLTHTLQYQSRVINNMPIIHFFSLLTGQRAPSLPCAFQWNLVQLKINLLWTSACCNFQYLINRMRMLLITSCGCRNVSSSSAECLPSYIYKRHITKSLQFSIANLFGPYEISKALVN